MGAVPRFSADLAKDPYYRWLNNNFLLLQLPLAGLLFLIGSLTGAGGWACALGHPLRLVFVYVTAGNSATHAGVKPSTRRALSRNNPWVAALTFGEGAQPPRLPHSAKHGLEPGQIDLTWQHIRLMRALGLATQVRLPAG